MFLINWLLYLPVFLFRSQTLYKKAQENDSNIQSSEIAFCISVLPITRLMNLYNAHVLCFPPFLHAGATHPQLVNE